MATKNVAIDLEAYDLLRKAKKQGESFSDAIRRLAKPPRRIAEFAGIWANIPAEERAELKRAYAAVQEADRRRAMKLERLRG